jgi:hypothetical protein
MNGGFGQFLSTFAGNTGGEHQFSVAAFWLEFCQVYRSRVSHRGSLVQLQPWFRHDDFPWNLARFAWILNPVFQRDRLRVERDLFEIAGRIAGRSTT